MSKSMHVVMVLGSLPVGHNRRRTMVWAVSPSTWVAKVGGAIIGVESNTHIKGTNPIPRKTDTHSGDPGGGRKKGAEKKRIRKKQPAIAERAGLD